MAPARRFEDLQVWQEASALAVEVYRVDRALSDQLRRAAVSVLSNIAEGFERDGCREFCQFLRIAEGSAGEVRSLLRPGFSLGYLPAQQHDALIASSETLSRRISRFITTLRRPAPAPVSGARPPTAVT
jgi:four helix bundle protein